MDEFDEQREREIKRQNVGSYNIGITKGKCRSRPPRDRSREVAVAGAIGELLLSRRGRPFMSDKVTSSGKGSAALCGENRKQCVTFLNTAFIYEESEKHIGTYICVCVRV